MVEIYTQLLLGEKALWTPLRLLSSYLPRIYQKMILELMLQDLSKKFLAPSLEKEDNSKLIMDGKEAVGGVASIISGFIGDNEYLEAQLIEWLTKTSGSYAANTVEARRAFVLVLSAKEGKSSPKICSSRSDISSERLRMLLEKSMKAFSDKLHIKHDSMLQHEG